MKRKQLTKNLWLDEYIPKEMYIKYQHKLHWLTRVLDERMIKADQMLRDRFGSVTINNWMSGGVRNESGLRTPECKHYSLTSGHTIGKCSDKIFKVTAEEVLDDIKKNYRTYGITEIETGVSWVHSGVRWYDNDILNEYAIK
jgi:hypothetical protein